MDEVLISKLVDYGLKLGIEDSELLIQYYGSGIEYYRNLIKDLEKNKPLFFQKKKFIEYNTKLKEYNVELSKLYSKMEDEIKFINEVENIL